MKDENKNTEAQKLITCIRNGDQAAFNALLELYEPLVRSEVTRYGEGLSSFDCDDLRQVALMAFYRAVLSFDLEQEEVAFGLYASGRGASLTRAGRFSAPHEKETLTLPSRSR